MSSVRLAFSLGPCALHSPCADPARKESVAVVGPECTVAQAIAKLQQGRLVPLPPVVTGDAIDTGGLVLYRRPTWLCWMTIANRCPTCYQSMIYSSFSS